MKRQSQKILLMVAAFLPLFSLCQKRDSVFLYKGQVLIGDIKKVDLGILTIDDVDLKLTDIKLYKIKKLSTAQQLRIETSDKHIYFGKLGETAKNGWTNILSLDSQKISIQITDISTMSYLGKSFFKRLDGNAGAGFSFTKSSSVGQFNVNAALGYVTKTIENNLQLSAIGSIDSSKYSRDNESAELFTNYNLNSTWFVAGLLAYQRNLELSIARRFQEMIGAGNKIVVTKNLQILAISGLTFNQEKSAEDEKSPILLEIPVMLRLNFYKFKHPNLQVGTTQAIYFSLSEKRVRYSGSTDFSWELIQNFSFTLNFYCNFDSKPPAESNSKTDYGIVMGFTYKF